MAYIVYDDDLALGKAAPSLAALKYIKGEPVDFAGAKATIVLFWAKFAEGDYPVIVDVSKLKAKYPGDLQVVGVSIDPAEEHAVKFVGKLGTAMPEISVNKLEADFSLAFDADKSVRTAYQKIAGLSTISASAIFVVNAAGVIVWREQFGQKQPIHSGKLEAQLNHIFKSEPLDKFGEKPKAEEEEEEMAFDGDDMF